MRTGENAFRHVHGTDSWTFRARHPELSAGFDRAMTALARQVAAAVLAAYDFGRFGTVVDVGGGNGAFLAAILARHPATRGVLFDQPHVVAGAPPVLAAAGVADRCEVVGGSFFEAVPAGGDAYVLKSILHDWEDADCVRILGAAGGRWRTGRRCWWSSASSARPTRTRTASSPTSTCWWGRGDGSARPRSTPPCSRRPGSGSSASRRATVGTGVFEGRPA